MLCRHAEAAIAHLVAAEAELDAYKGLRSGRLRLSSFLTAGSVLVPRAMSTFRSRHPDVAVSLEQLEHADAVPRLKNGDLEIAVTFEYNVEPRPPDDLLSRRLLSRERVFVALPTEHRLAGKRSLRLADLARESWVQATHAGLPLDLLARAAAVPGFAQTLSFEGDDAVTVQTLVEAGLGVAIVPEIALDHRRDIVIRTLAGDPLEGLVLATTLKATMPSPGVAEMLDALTDAAASIRRDAVTVDGH